MRTNEKNKNNFDLTIVKKNKMRHLNKEQIEVFEDLIVDLENEDIEFIEAFYLDTTDRIETINQLVFRKFNDIITNEEIEKIFKKYEEPNEFAAFKIVYIGDLIILFAYL